MGLEHYLEGQEFLKTASFLLAWFLVLVTFLTQRSLARKAPESARSWRWFLSGVLFLCLSISLDWLHLAAAVSFLKGIEVVKTAKLIGVTLLGVGLYHFVQE